MIHHKTPQEIAIMKKGGKILSEVLFEVLDHAVPGISELELDQLAERLIRKKGGEPGFQKVAGYHHAICISTNDVVVHGVPSNYTLQSDDVVGIDCGVFLQGFHTDMSETVRIQNSKFKIQNKGDNVDKFLETGKKALELGIEQVKPGNRVGHISKAIQMIVEGAGYSVVHELIGHGVGRALHEDPPIPGYLDKPIESTPLLKEGMTIAVEVIYNMGKREITHVRDDDWTIKTKDGKISGLFERTVAVTKNGHEILTGS